MNYEKDFETFLNEILTDLRNQFPDLDLSKGSLEFVRATALAAALWGINKGVDYVARQIFPDSADTAGLDRHAFLHGLTRNLNETDPELLARLILHIRRPPAGGNKYDYVRWATEVTNVKKAYCIPNGQGVGTVDVVVLADAAVTGSEIPSSHSKTGSATGIATNKLIDAAANFTDATPVRIGDIVKNTTTGDEAAVTAVDSATQLTLALDIFLTVAETYSISSLCAQAKDHIDDVRPVTVKTFRAIAPTVITQDVTITVTGANIDKAQIKADIEDYINSLEPGETLYKARLVAIAIAAGADNATVSTPVNDVTCSTTQIIRPGVVNVL